MAQPLDPSAPTDTACGRIGRVGGYARRHAWAIFGIALWAAAGAVVGLHAHGLAPRDPTQFSMLACCLIGGGCMGSPNWALRMLGDRLTPNACRMVSVLCVGCAVLLTVLFSAGAMRPLPLVATFSLILPEAAFIQAWNTGDAQSAIRRAGSEQYKAGYAAGREDEAAGHIDIRYAAMAGVDKLEGMTPALLETHIEVACRILESKRSGHPLLSLVPAAGGRNRGAVNGSGTAWAPGMQANGARPS